MQFFWMCAAQENMQAVIFLTHHDASHYVLYRVAKDIETAERIGDQIYNLEIDEAGFRRRTRSLHPYVAEIYGWKAGRFNKAKKAV